LTGLATVIAKIKLSNKPPTLAFSIARWINRFGADIVKASTAAAEIKLRREALPGRRHQERGEVACFKIPKQLATEW
jgi:hypothetical protein